MHMLLDSLTKLNWLWGWDNGGSISVCLPVPREAFGKFQTQRRYDLVKLAQTEQF